MASSSNSLTENKNNSNPFRIDRDLELLWIKVAFYSQRHTLHMADVEKLIKVLHRLVDGGHSVVVIEHDLDVIAEADWVIDLGPDGGNAGGRVVAAATPEGVVRRRTHTGEALKHVLAR